MRRILPVILALTALVAGGSSASASSANVKVLDYANGVGTFSLGNTWIQAQFYWGRTTNPEPEVDPGSIFPIVVDPNDPPNPPVSAVDAEVTFSGNIYICNFSVFDCSAYTTTDPEGFSLEDLVLRGNSMSWTEDGVATGGLGALPFTMTFTLSRPSQTRVAPFDGYQLANPWTHESEVHFDAQAWQPVMLRDGYVLEAQISFPSGDYPLLGGGSFAEYLDADADVDAP